jgi:capsular exopolysaccharide synthesis family protein
MNKESKKESGGGYYGGYYYGEGSSSYGYSGDARSGQASRSLKDYLIILRERIWYLIVSVFVVFMATAIITFNMEKVYTASSTVQVLRQEEKTTQFESVVDTTVKNVEDFNTQIKILESIGILERVAKRLKDKELRDFIEPYKDNDPSLSGELLIQSVLFENRKIIPQRLTLVVGIEFSHPVPSIAANVANYFAEEFLNYNTSLRTQGSMRAVDDLKVRADQQRDKVRELELQLTDFKEKNNSISLDVKTNIDQQEMLSLTQTATNDKKILDEAETQWRQVETIRASGRDLWELSLIAHTQQVPQLLQQLSINKIEISSLEKKYRAKHPLMIQATIALEQTQTELNRAVNSAAENIYNLYLQAKSNFEKSQGRVDKKAKEMIDLERVRVEYSSYERNLKIAEEMYQYLYSRLQQALTQATDDAQTARIVDRAIEPVKPSKPRVLINLALGLIGGVGIGSLLIVALALLDDKIKTAFDIENSLGLPLLGIIPRIGKVDAHQKARVVFYNKDKHSVEAFRGIHSALKLNEESKKARCLLVTSTIPSEGKSFVSTNVAFTYASHGDRTIIIDGDLRMPNIAKSLQLENKAGVLQYIAGTATLDDVILKNVVPNADVLVSGGRTKNPTQILGGERFAQMIAELKTRYDRIVIDSPPLAPVSDALSILPLIDGMLYVVRFNMVKLKTAQINLKRLKDSNTPILGVILNNINSSVAGYYYSHYYDKSYSQYYLKNQDNHEDMVDIPENALAEKKQTKDA